MTRGRDDAGSLNPGKLIGLLVTMLIAGIGSWTIYTVSQHERAIAEQAVELRELKSSVSGLRDELRDGFKDLKQEIRRKP